MYRKNKYRIVTNGRKYRVQKLNKFLGIRWWSFIGSASFDLLRNADASMRSHESLDQCLRNLQEEKCRERWVAVEKERGGENE